MQCVAQPDCKAWTLTPPANCLNRLPTPPKGCCYLKAGSGWQVVQNATTVPYSSGAGKPRFPLLG